MSKRKSLAEAIPASETPGSRQEMISLSQLRRDGGTQGRSALNPKHVATIAAAYKEGARIPAADAKYDGTNYWMYDGFHRAAGAEDAGLKAILVNVTQGTQRDAILLSLKANKDQLGLPRTHEDITRAILRVLEDEEWGDQARFSNYLVAEMVGTSEATVRRHRSSFQERRNAQILAEKGTPASKPKTAAAAPTERPTSPQESIPAITHPIPTDTPPQPVTVQTRNGKTMNVANLQAQAGKPKVKVEPAAPKNALIPQPGDLWTPGRHQVYCGASIDPTFRDALPDRIDLAFLTLPPQSPTWDEDWVGEKAEVVAVLVQEAAAVYELITQSCMSYQYAMAAILENQWGYLALFSDRALDEFDDANTSANQLLAGAIAAYSPAGGTVMVINSPSPNFSPLLVSEAIDRTCIYCDYNAQRIANQVVKFRENQPLAV